MFEASWQINCLNHVGICFLSVYILLHILSDKRVRLLLGGAPYMFTKVMVGVLSNFSTFVHERGTTIVIRLSIKTYNFLYLRVSSCLLDIPCLSGQGLPLAVDDTLKL